MSQFNSVSPRLTVANLARTIAFYRDVLDFDAGDGWPADEPTFVVMTRGRVTLQFQQTGGDRVHGMATLCFDVDDAMAVFRAVADRVEVAWGPEVYGYGRREFSFHDPDGYPILISEETADPPTCDG